MRFRGYLAKLPLVRAAVFIDGLNFHYGALRGREWKWLDVEKWASVIVPRACRLDEIHYFASLPGGTNQPAAARQALYFRALAKHSGPDGKLRLHLGRRRNERIIGRRPGGDEKIAVVVPKEKGSDVNLAARMVADAARDRFDVAVLVSNDSDFAEACVMLQEEFDKGVLLFPPLLNNRFLSEDLEAAVGPGNTMIIRPGPLKSCQLPKVIPGTKIRRPPEW